MNKQEAIRFLSQMYKDIVVNFDFDKIPEYFDKDYYQVTDGKKVDMEGFKNHLAALKAIVDQVAVSPFYDALYDEELQTLALRYTVDVVKKSGARGSIELIAIFEIKDNKIVRCNEISRALHDQNGFEELASVVSPMV
ncbi:nuclear transport factor 2 family protein [Paenibacillus senegalensis]|uniref:nuclear transport factor 2 family protein n=1 Tax=Paenibacillus senegalensis TaxID=1465766 RepID=UPI0002891758|nr:nuclear transport factor 2 family protein [Paenibacillus senegalensis]